MFKLPLLFYSIKWLTYVNSPVDIWLNSEHLKSAEFFGMEDSPDQWKGSTGKYVADVLADTSSDMVNKIATVLETVCWFPHLTDSLYSP